MKNGIEEYFSGDKEKIDFSDAVSGIYILQLTAGDKIQSYKFSKE